MRSVYTEAVALHQIHLLLSVLYEQVVVLCTAREGMKGIPVPLQVIFASDKDSGLKNVTGPMLAAQNSTTFLLTGLVINTLYSISVRAVTGAGPGENVTDSISTAEDGEGDPHTCMHKHTHTHTFMQARAHTHTYTHTRTHTSRHARTPHTYAHTSPCTSTSCAHLCTHGHTTCLPVCILPCSTTSCDSTEQSTEWKWHQYNMDPSWLGERRILLQTVCVI